MIIQQVCVKSRKISKTDRSSEMYVAQPRSMINYNISKRFNIQESWPTERMKIIAFRYLKKTDKTDKKQQRAKCYM